MKFGTKKFSSIFMMRNKLFILHLAELKFILPWIQLDKNLL